MQVHIESILLKGGESMKREEHTEKIMKIKERTHETDDGTITSLLSELSDDYATLLTQIDETNLRNEKLTKDNDSLRDANMRLFLKVEGADEKASQPETSESDDPKTYENLFDENGELK